MNDYNFSPFPLLESERMLLGRVTSEHVQDLFEIRSDPGTMRFIPRPVAKTPADAQLVIDMIDEGIKLNERINWGLFSKENNKLIGVAGYVKINKNNSRAEVGYVLNAAYHGKGLMQEALNVILPYGFHQLNFNCIEAIIDPANEASIRVIEKQKFKKEGLLRDYTWHNEKFSDALVYSKLKREL